MKKKLFTIGLTLACAACCAGGLAACGDDGGDDLLGVILATAENPSDKIESVTAGNFVYGEDDKINEALGGIKFFKHFGNNTYEEVAESELTVRYVKDSTTLSSKPSKYTAASGVSNYSFVYSIEGATNVGTVFFTVDQTTSDDFSITLSKTAWKYGEPTTAVTLKNPAGTVMTQVDDSGLHNENDTDYSWVQLFAMKKTDYTAAGASAKSYSILTTIENDDTKPNHGYNKHFGQKLINYSENDAYADNITQGDYVLIACVDSTNNYKEIVCATEFTVTAQDSPFGKTFVLTDLKARGDSGAEAPDEIIDMAANLKENKSGETLICEQDGKVKGTFSFISDTPFDSFTGDDAFTLTFGREADEWSLAEPFYVSVKNGYEDQNRVLLEGDFRNGTLVLSLQQWTDGDTQIPYYFIFTFTVQPSAN